jgi:hypothetical protein
MRSPKAEKGQGRQKDPERSPVRSDEAGTSGGVSEAAAGCSVLTTERAGGNSQGRPRGELVASPAPSRGSAVCTWMDCSAEATQPQLAGAGGRRYEWATHCQAHHDELERAIEALDAPRLVRCWARARAKRPPL